MQRHIRSLLLLMPALMMISACVTASGPEFTPAAAPSGGGVIYVYNLNGFGGYGEGPVLLVDGEEAGTLQKEGFLAIPVSAGEHTVTMKSVLVGIPLIGHDQTVSVASGGSTYLRIDRKFDSIVYSGGGAYSVYVNAFHPVTNSVGRKEIAQTRQSG